jgi:ABC-2 type transport system ATP-binding protein
MMIETQDLSKRFGDVLAVDRLTLQVSEGEVFGLLGPNGAGKTTTVRMLTALVGPSSGTAAVDGHVVGQDNAAIRGKVGILTEAPGLYENLSAEFNLRTYADLYDVPDPQAQVAKYLRMLGLWERRGDEVGTFSKGMKQKLAACRALLHEPRVLFLDEPTSALDPEAAHLMRDFIVELRGQGRTIVLCTHNLDEADRLCDRIGVLKTGLLAVDTPARLRAQLFGRKVVVHLRAMGEPYLEAVQALGFVREAKAVDNMLVLTLDDPEGQNPDVLRALIGAGADVQFVGELRRSLEDVYLTLVQGV